MLTPDELATIADTMYPLLDELNQWIIRDVVSRMMAMMERGDKAELGATDQWQVELYRQAAGHYESLAGRMAEWLGLAADEVRSIFEDAGIRAWSADDAFYVAQGLPSVNILKNDRLMEILEDCYHRTQGEMANLTRTIAESSQRAFIRVCDEAHMKVITGAQSYTAAVEQAVRILSTEQTRVVYPSGHSDTIETAVLRCVRTGTAQASGNMTIQGMIENDWDVILVSAHLGARTGDGGENPGNHFWWQGKFYSRAGKTPDLPSFVETTGYGTGAGLSGWNCRHSFGPGVLGHNPYMDYDAAENQAMYELTQTQRAMERTIRRQKDRLIGLQAALDSTNDMSVKEALFNEYQKQATRLGEQNMKYSSFCEEHSLARYDDRLDVARWNRTHAKNSILASYQV